MLSTGSIMGKVFPFLWNFLQNFIPFIYILHTFYTT